MTQINWKYPSRDGWPPEEEKAYLVTLDLEHYTLCPVQIIWWQPQYHGKPFAFGFYSMFGMGMNDRVLAWAELPEPAKPLD